jgi:HEAT repeat protein
VCPSKSKGEIGDSRAAGPLIEAIKDENRGVRSAATETLAKIRAGR